jgi:hypothetical protein
MHKIFRDFFWGPVLNKQSILLCSGHAKHEQIILFELGVGGIKSLPKLN